MLALAASAVLAQEKVEFKVRHAEGDMFDVRTHMTMNLASAVQGQSMSMKQESKKEYRDKTLTVKDGRPVRVERTYRSPSGTRR